MAILLNGWILNTGGVPSAQQACFLKIRPLKWPLAMLVLVKVNVNFFLLSSREL